MTLEEKIELLVAKDEIREVIHTYCRAADVGDLELLAELYHPDAVDERQYNAGTTVPSFIAGLASKLPTIEYMHHHVANTVIKIDGNYAEAETFVLTNALGQGEGTTFRAVQGGRYLDKLERRDGAWRFIHRRVVGTWSHGSTGDINGVTAETHPAHMRSRMGPDDPSHKFFTLFKRGER